MSKMHWRIASALALVIAFGSAGSAQARFLQVDPVGYDDQINLYTYVANDPVNNRDPSGRYICEGSRTNCGAVRAALQRGRDALANKDLSKSDRAAISGVLKTYGKEGVRNGVGVVFLVGSSRVDLQACKLEYSIVSPK